MILQKKTKMNIIQIGSTFLNIHTERYLSRVMDLESKHII